MATKYSFNADIATEQQCPLAIAFLKSQIKGKGDVVLYSLERMLETVTNIGIELPDTKADLVSIINLINHFNISTNSSPALSVVTPSSVAKPISKVSSTTKKKNNEESNKKKVQRQSSNKSFTKVNTKPIVNQEEDDDTDTEAEALFNSYEDSSTIEKESTVYVDTRSPGDRAMDEEFLGI